MHKNQILGLCGVALLAIGTFLPIVTVPMAGSVTYFHNEHGILLLIFAAVAAFFVFRKRYRWLVFPGAAALVLLGYGFFNLKRTLAEVQPRFNAEWVDGSNTPLPDAAAAMVNGALEKIQFQWGWGILLAGALLLILAGLLRPQLRTDSITEAIKSLDPSVLKRLPFSRKRGPKKEIPVEAAPQPDFTAPIAGDDSRECGIEGRKYLLSNNFEQALAALSKAIDLDPTNRSAYYHRGLVYQKLGQKRLAQSDFQAAADLGHRTAQGLSASKKLF
jgi:tetratricopeptide (TPR) repeat protein